MNRRLTYNSRKFSWPAYAILMVIVFTATALDPTCKPRAAHGASSYSSGGYRSYSSPSRSYSSPSRSYSAPRSTPSYRFSTPSYKPSSAPIRPPMPRVTGKQPSSIRPISPTYTAVRSVSRPLPSNKPTSNNWRERRMYPYEPGYMHQHYWNSSYNMWPWWMFWITNQERHSGWTVRDTTKRRKAHPIGPLRSKGNF